MATCLNTDANAGCPSSAGGGGSGGTGNEPLLWKSNSGESGGDGGDGSGDTGRSSAHMTTGIPWRESAPPVGALPWRGADDPVASVAGIASSACRGGSVGGGGGGNGSGMEVMEVSKVRPMNNRVSIPAAMSPAGVPFETAVTGRSRGMGQQQAGRSTPPQARFGLEHRPQAEYPRGVLQVPLGVLHMGSSLPSRGSATLRQTSRSPLQLQPQRHVMHQPTMMQMGPTASLSVPTRFSNTVPAPPRDASPDVPSPPTVALFPQLSSAALPAGPAQTDRTTHAAGAPKVAEAPPGAKSPEAPQAPQVTQALQGKPIPPIPLAPLPAPDQTSPPEAFFPRPQKARLEASEQPLAVPPPPSMPVLTPPLPETPAPAPAPAIFAVAPCSVPVVPSVAATTGSPVTVAVFHPPVPRHVPEPTPTQSPPPPPLLPPAPAVCTAPIVIPPAAAPKRPHEDGESASIGDDTASTASLQESCRKRSKFEEVIRPVGSPVQEPALEIPEVSEADVGKFLLSETMSGALTGVVEKFTERNGLGVWSIRYENGEVEEMDDCGELHDDMCAYYEFAGNAATAPAKQVRTRSNPLVQEQIRFRFFKDKGSVLGRRVCMVREKVPCDGEVTEYVQPTRDGEIEQWRVTYRDNGGHENLESFELVRPLLRHVERRIEQREVRWGHRRLVAYIHRTGIDECRPFATLAGISASLPPTI